MKPLLTLVMLLPFSLTGCLGDGDGDNAQGERLFLNAGCGDCHTLGAAGTKGKTGPNLDELKPDTSAVVKQVVNGGVGMPSFADKLTTEEIYELASFVKSASASSSVASNAVFEPTSTKLEDCSGDDQECWEQAFGNLTYEKGPKVALPKLAAAMEANRAIYNNCHRIAHNMGGAGLLRLEDTGRAFAEGNAVCWSGYYHGVLEDGFAGTPSDQLDKQTRDLCSDPSLQRDAFLLYQCVHGLGHGLMIYTGYDLPGSLESCEALLTDWERQACVGGAFMENFSDFYKVSSEWLKEDDLLYPCNDVARRHKYYCYYQVTSRVLRKVDWDWEETARLCRSAERGWESVCFESLGRDASGFSGRNARQAIDLCRLAREHMDACVYAIARDIVNNDGGRYERVVRFCSAVPAGVEPDCHKGIGTTVALLEGSVARQKRTCTRLSGPYAGFCFYGVNFAKPEPAASTAGFATDQ